MQESAHVPCKAPCKECNQARELLRHDIEFPCVAKARTRWNMDRCGLLIDWHDTIASWPHSAFLHVGLICFSAFGLVDFVVFLVIQEPALAALLIRGLKFALQGRCPSSQLGMEV